MRIPLNAEQRSFRPGTVPYWGANSIQGYVDEPLVNEEIVLIGEDGAPFFDRDRPVAFRINEPIWPNNHIHVLKPREYVDARWLAYALNDVDYSLYVLGSTRDKLTQAALLSITLPDADSARQRRIADYLDRETAQIDTLIAKQEQLIATLRERRMALVEHTLKNLSLEPETTMTAIRRIGVTSSGAGFPPAEQGQKGLELPFFKVKNLSAHGRLKYSTADDTISRETASRLRATVFPAGTVCYAKVGAALLLGRFRRTTTPACIDNNMSGLIPNDRVDADYLLWALTRVRFEALVNPGAVPSLSDSKFVEWKLPVPPLEKQAAVATQLQIQTAKIDTLIAKAERFIELSKERRAALITAAVTGQIDIPA